jgi:hypothetical protein
MLQRMVCDSCWCRRHSAKPLQELQPAVVVAHQKLLGASGWTVDRSIMFGSIWLRSFAARNAAWPEARLCIRSSLLPVRKDWRPLGNRVKHLLDAIPGFGPGFIPLSALRFELHDGERK